VASGVSALARPPVVVLTLFLAAALVQPFGGDVPGGVTLRAAALLMTAVVLVARATIASDRRGAALLAVGACLVVAALGADGVRGRRGKLTLLPGQAESQFDEEGPGGRPLGPRPLGFDVGLDAVRPGGGATLLLPGRTAPTPLTPRRAVEVEGFRLGDPHVGLAGGAGHPELSVRIGVHRQPAAAVALLGAILALAGVALERRPAAERR
jgi:hypothetical protein